MVRDVLKYHKRRICQRFEQVAVILGQIQSTHESIRGIELTLMKNNCTCSNGGEETRMRAALIDHLGSLKVLHEIYLDRIDWEYERVEKLLSEFFGTRFTFD